LTASPYQRIDALIGVGLRLARSAPTGRVALARAAEALDLEWIPRPWGDELAHELAAAREASLENALSPSEVERALRAAWGTKPTDELDELDLEPAAVTPAAQVHRAVHEGSPVAVKLLRSGLASAVRQDMALLDGLLAPLSAAFPALDPRAVLAEVRERVLEELDLESEAESQRRFHRALRGHPFLSVPAPVMRLATDHVLVSGWVDGAPIKQAPDRDKAAARLLVFVLGALRTGAMPVDPHPDDVLVQDDGRLVILDFGLTRAVKPDRVATAAQALEAFANDDAAGLGAALERLGWLPAEHGELTLELARHALGDLAGPDPALLDSAAVIAVRDRLLERPKDLGRLLTAGAVPPDDLWPVNGVARLFGTIARVGARGRWLELARTALREGWETAA
jgi:hypothetical protein